MRRVCEVRGVAACVSALLVFRDRQSGGHACAHRALGCLHLLALSKRYCSLPSCSRKVRMQRATPQPLCWLSLSVASLAPAPASWLISSPGRCGPLLLCKRSLLGLPRSAFLKGVPLGVAWFGRGSVCVQPHQTGAQPWPPKWLNPAPHSQALFPRVVFCSIGTCGAWRELCLSPSWLFKHVCCGAPLSGVGFDPGFIRPPFSQWLSPPPDVLCCLCAETAPFSDGSSSSAWLPSRGSGLSA